MIYYNFLYNVNKSINHLFYSIFNLFIKSLKFYKFMIVLEFYLWKSIPENSFDTKVMIWYKL